MARWRAFGDLEIREAVQILATPLAAPDGPPSAGNGESPGRAPLPRQLLTRDTHNWVIGTTLLALAVGEGLLGYYLLIPGLLLALITAHLMVLWH